MTTTTNELSWLQKHERLLLVTLGSILLFVLFWNWLNRHYEVAKQSVVTQQATLDDQKKINQTLQDNYDRLQKQTEQINQTLQDQNEALAAQTAAALKAVATQRAADAAMTNSQLAQRLGDLSNQKNIQSNKNGIDLTHDQSVGVTQTLEDVPALKTEVANDNQIIADEDKEILNLTTQSQDATLLITGLNTQLKDETSTCKAELTKAKLSGIKSRFRWFGAGVIVGFIGREFLHLP